LKSRMTRRRLVGRHTISWVENYFFGATCGFSDCPMNCSSNRAAPLSNSFGADPINGRHRGRGVPPAQRDSAVQMAQGGCASPSPLEGDHDPGQRWNRCTGGLHRCCWYGGCSKSTARPTAGQADPLLGWAIAANVLLPIIPAKDGTDRGNALTLTGEFGHSTGDADQSRNDRGRDHAQCVSLAPGIYVNYYGKRDAHGQRVSPLIGTPYNAQRRSGLVGSIERGHSHYQFGDIVVGIQYYLPPTGRVFVSGNYSQGKIQQHPNLFHPLCPISHGSMLGRIPVFAYGDGNIFFDLTPAVRMGLSYQRVDQKLAEDTSVHNNRFEMTFSISSRPGVPEAEHASANERAATMSLSSLRCFMAAAVGLSCYESPQSFQPITTGAKPWTPP